MKKRMRSVTAVFLLLALVASLIPPLPVSAASNTSAVGELVDSYAANSQTFSLSESSRIFVVADTEPAGDLLQTVQLIQRQFAADSRPASTPMALVWGPESWIADGDIVIRLDEGSGVGAEGYELNVTTTAEITVSDVDGLIYGANMLLKHLRYANSNSIQGFTAADAPDTVQRAVSLDCGRKYYTKDWICNFIREMSWMGYNTLQFHFSDDSGFRFDLWDEAYYTGDFQPKNDFSWICGSNYTSWTLSAYKNDADKGKYLTTAEVVEILQTAKEYHIDVIPCFDSPSHLDYLTWTFEQNYDSNPAYSFYSTYDQKTYYAADVNGCINYTGRTDASTALQWPYYSAVNVVQDQGKAFIFELYTDIAAFFKKYAGSTDMSVGADEVQLSTSNLASGYSYAWGFADFVDYINELNALLNSKGYTMRMYNDFMGSISNRASSYDFADNIEVQYWDSPFNPSSSTASNHTEPVSYYVEEGRILYNCIQTNTYYALRKTSSGSDARSVNNRQWTFYHANEEDIYNEWYSADISEHGDYSEDVEDVPAANLGGAYFLIWCDYACVSTEQEIWNGCYDTSGSGEYYSLRDRMWSNTIKMWNWDVNDSMTFEEYATIRDAYGDFPGCGTTTTSCSEKTVLPTATEITSGYAGGCESYNAYGQVQITVGTSIMTLPCSAATESTSTVLETASAGERYTVTYLYENTVGELWYKVQTRAGLVGYVRATDTQYVADLVDDITVTGAATPSAHVAGDYFLVRGDIQSKYNALETVAVYIYEGFGRNGSVVTGGSDAVTDHYYSLLYSTIDNNTAFGDLTVGAYTYAILANYQSHYANGDAVVTNTDTVYLVEEPFMVVSLSVDQSTCSHSYSETVLSEAACTTEGVKVYACATCGHVYQETIAAAGHKYDTETIGATCVEYEKVRYTCRVCGDTYVAYPEDIMSQWQDTKPSGIDDSLIETKVVYRYSDYETATSYATSLAGYTQIGSEWVKDSTGSVLYVNSWPSGFSTSSSLYTQYNNKSNKVSAVETDTMKRVINSDAVAGYLYYHWCYNNSYYSSASKSGSYTTFHAYYSTTAPGNYTCDYSDYSYCTAHSTCSNSDWYFVAYVYAQKYTDYNKLFTYERWTDYSDWSDVPVTASTTRKVETKTMYRYVDGTYADHAWVDGICSVCGTGCTHTYQNNVCTSCGLAKPLKDYYLFGYINGANYACEEDYENLGEYKFVDGQVVVTFSEDSYVAIKSGDNADWYMTDGWQGFVSSATLYKTTTLSSSDKLYVPGQTQVTFTLVDNGDDTYILSYVAVACTHEKHSTDGICTVCGASVEHVYVDGSCSCGLVCEHNMENGYCTICGAECNHVYQNNICTICGASKPVQDYYLFGYINGANYACEEDYENLGEYKFVDGQLTVFFTSESYVAVKAADNKHWYMTDGWQGFVSSATLYNTETLGTTADKLYVPANTNVTFTLVDNGDDTYVLSYTAEACTHEKHTTAGVCSVCGAAVEHVYVNGYCSCGKECDHDYVSSVCTICGMTCGHRYENNICVDCGAAKVIQDMYLFGWINGADYGCEDDYANLGIYQFVDGRLEAFFTADSYVGVKTADCLNWYMTAGHAENETSVTLYHSDAIDNEDKLFVPGNKIVTFTLVDNGNDTYTLSYVAVECPHESHDTDGICAVCGGTVAHSFKDGWCACGLACTHSYADGVCAICGLKCSHNWLNGKCQICGMFCDHEWAEGVCTVCGRICVHTWQDGVCTVCAVECGHSWENGACTVCGMTCSHTYENNVCTNCGFNKPAVDYYLFGVINGADYAYGTDAANLGEYLFVESQLVVTFRQDSYVGVRASDKKGWYMTDGDMGQVTSVQLYSTAAISTGELLYVPGCMTITFTLVDNGDDTLTLCYAAVECRHESHDANGLCTLCGTEVSHSYDAVVTAPTCTTDGYTTHTCLVCGDSYIDSPVAAPGHSYDVAITDPTCTENGSAAYSCSVCGVSYSEVITAPGHSYETTVTEPTCTEAGSTTSTCTVCGHSYTETIAALGHSYEVVVTAPTCTQDGYTTHTCTACGDTYTDAIVAATGHRYDDGVVTTQPTCTDEGVKTFTCDCGSSYTEVVAALGHSYEVTTTAPTCTEGGYTTHTCTVCGDSYTDSEVAALGHSYEVTITAPTCTEDGYTTHTCTVCGDTYTDSIVAATGHSYDGVITMAPTCTETGVKTFTCGCGASYTESVAALGHAVVTDAAVNATCTETGLTEGSHCQTCGETLVAQEVLPATGHNYEQYVHDATCKEYADYEVICPACGDNYIYHAEDMADWMYEIPVGMDASLFVVETQYRYSDYEFVVSKDTSMDGYTLADSQWISTGTNTIYYVQSWNSGFDTTSDIYAAYNNLDKKVSAYVTETAKLEIDSDAIIGYLYCSSISSWSSSCNSTNCYYWCFSIN